MPVLAHSHQQYQYGCRSQLALAPRVGAYPHRARRPGAPGHPAHGTRHTLHAAAAAERPQTLPPPSGTHMRRAQYALRAPRHGGARRRSHRPAGGKVRYAGIREVREVGAVREVRAVRAVRDDGHAGADADVDMWTRTRTWTLDTWLLPGVVTCGWWLWVLGTGFLGTWVRARC